MTAGDTSEPRVRLRMAMVDDGALLELWRTDEYLGEFNDFGLGRRPLNQAQARELGTPRGGGDTMIVEIIETGEPVGSVSWRAVSYGPNAESIAWNIGINLIPAARGRGFGVEAQQLLARHLFVTTPVHRIEAMTDLENVAEQRALEKAGFSREGTLIGAQFRAGGWHDLVVYAVVRGQES